MTNDTSASRSWSGMQRMTQARSRTDWKCKWHHWSRIATTDKNQRWQRRRPRMNHHSTSRCWDEKAGDKPSLHSTTMENNTPYVWLPLIRDGAAAGPPGPQRGRTGPRDFWKLIKCDRFLFLDRMAKAAPKPDSSWPVIVIESKNPQTHPRSIKCQQWPSGRAAADRDRARGLNLLTADSTANSPVLSLATDNRRFKASDLNVLLWWRNNPMGKWNPSSMWRT
jgi:hypothetical protein